jgi:hypothetical protein
MMEIWKDIKGYEGYYQVSNAGRVKSLPRRLERRGRWHMNIRERILKPAINRKGYERIRLCVQMQERDFSVHRLVAEAFLPNPESKPEVNHINCNKADNRVDNLEWATTKENVTHAIANNLRRGLKGERSAKAMLTNAQAAELRAKYGSRKMTIRELSNETNISYTVVQKIVTNKSYL